MGFYFRRSRKKHNEIMMKERKASLVSKLNRRQRKKDLLLHKQTRKEKFNKSSRNKKQNKIKVE